MHVMMGLGCSALLMPQVVADDRQEFMGVAYTPNPINGYFVSGKLTLHREVWSANFGTILRRNHVHHDDRNRTNNHPLNLESLTPKEHAMEHVGESVARLVPSQRASTVTFNCIECGKETTKLRRGQNKFCSHQCQNRVWLRRKTDHKISVCEVCSNEYTRRRSLKGKFCSRACYHVAQRAGAVKCRST